VHLSSTLAN